MSTDGMLAPLAAPPSAPRSTLEGWRQSLLRRAREFRLIGQDPVLLVGLAAVAVFVFVFIIFPILRVVVQGFFTIQGQPSVEYFGRYFDAYYSRFYRLVLWRTLIMGVSTAIGSTALGFLFAYTIVRCDPPFPRLTHVLALLPTVSPPFAIAIAMILLFGRSGLVTNKLLGITFGPGMNDIYGLDGLVFVQIITFFSISYLIIRGMLERLDPALEEAALSLGAAKGHIFRTVTLPLLVPGLAGSLLLLFVESLADLGNPLLLDGGPTAVLSAQIWIAVNGEYDQQKAAALSLVLLIPTMTVYLLQRYWVSRRSYISVTGKPTGGALRTREPWIRWPLIAMTGLSILLVLALYLTIVVGSLTKLWGVNYTLDLRHYQTAFNRGLEAIVDTTFLSAVATPIAGLAGMLIAFLVVRKAFSGKETLDFTSTLGAAVPGTILGIGYIIAFITPPLIVAVPVYLLIAYMATAPVSPTGRVRLTVLLAGMLGGLGLAFVAGLAGAELTVYLGALALVVLAVAGAVLAPVKNRRSVFLVLAGMGVYLALYNAILFATEPVAAFGRTHPGTVWPKLFTSLADQINIFFQPPWYALGLTYALLGSYAASRLPARARPVFMIALIAVSAGLAFAGKPLALVGSPYIIIAAYAVRSLPASVRAGVAGLQQIDPSIEEASTNLGADAQHTFRRITLPLILPAFIAGLIFSFARHMTSLSAIIFLTTPKWQILTALILSEVEQGGMSLAAAYSVILIAIVLAAIGIMYFILGRTFATQEGVDLTLGAG